jgi:hypothetical protein
VWQAPDSDGGLTQAFIPARITDNPYLLESDPDYFKRLEGLGDNKAKAGLFLVLLSRNLPSSPS